MHENVVSIIYQLNCNKKQTNSKKLKNLTKIIFCLNHSIGFLLYYYKYLYTVLTLYKFKGQFIQSSLRK